MSFAKANNAAVWKSNEDLLKGSSYTLMAGFLYALVLVILNSLFDLRAFNVYSICLEGIEAKQNNPILIFVLVLLPLMIMIAVTCVMDFKCLVWLLSRRAVNPDTADTEDTAAVGCITIIGQVCH